jgi:hypothetical protein
VRFVEARILRKHLVEQSPELNEETHGVGAVFAGLLGRIFIMQAAVIFGGMMARSYGSNAPMYIVIVLKLLADLGGKSIGGGTLTMQTGSGDATMRTVKLPDKSSGL